MEVISENRAKSVKAEMLIPRKLKRVTTLKLRNAYLMKLEREYNLGTSVRQPERLKMYAELARRKKCKKLGIKSLNGNKIVMDSDTAKGGFSSLMFNGIPLIADSQCPANHLAFLNEAYIKLVVHKDEFFRFEPYVKPVNQNVRTAKIFFAGNLVSSNNRMHALFSALAS